MNEQLSPIQALRWYLEAGVDETIGEIPLDRFAVAAPASPAKPARTPGQMPPPAMERPAERPIERAIPSSPAPLPHAAKSPNAATAAHLALGCTSVAELKQAVEAYDGCALKKTCQRTVFADGNPEAKVMLIGEAPGSEEDRLGLPFVGASGRLLDRMLGSIGLDRSSVYISNVIFWRPPANRKPEPVEVELCLPFVERHIELVDPTLLIFLGGAAAAALLGRAEGIGRLRGRWHDYASPRMARPVPAMPTFHPAYLLRTPQHKREAWHDLLAVRKRLDGKTPTN